MMPGDTIGSLIKAARLERGWSQARLARELGVAEGRGRRGVDRGAVYRWERGTRVPDYWLPHLIQVLGMDPARVRVAGSGPRTPRYPVQAADTVASVIELGRTDLVERRHFMASSSYALAALGLPDLDALTRRTAASGPVTVGRGEVAAVRAMTKTLGDAAAELGGGHARDLAVRYLTEDIARWLNGRYTQATGRELFTAAAELVHLAGWMAGDDGEQGLAQRYYAHSYRLAAEAGHAEVSATALRGLAVQAIDLGYRAAAVRLSEACVRLGRSLDDPRATAYYQATLADAAALDGDRATATTALVAATTAIERAPAAPGTSWAGHYTPRRWAHHAGMVLARLGDLDAAEEHLRLALDTAGLNRRRSRAIVLADLGTLHLRRGDAEGALVTWSDFLDHAAGVRSVKITDAVTDMRARLARLAGVPAAVELDQRAAILT
ncbi:helix-turn-helix domain-containing protein [Streptomyces specialis]|uniref:helix-turn-helix domain-containing protein n=1 Tax=Streptomyces specialis TaxID=498367 RepID=UPI000B00DD6A|nr:helix-turn-helix transcriptional regulator [Streptomyces specialis]